MRIHSRSRRTFDFRLSTLGSAPGSQSGSDDPEGLSTLDFRLWGRYWSLRAIQRRLWGVVVTEGHLNENSKSRRYPTEGRSTNPNIAPLPSRSPAQRTPKSKVESLESSFRERSRSAQSRRRTFDFRLSTLGLLGMLRPGNSSHCEVLARASLGQHNPLDRSRPVLLNFGHENGFFNLDAFFDANHWPLGRLSQDVLLRVDVPHLPRDDAFLPAELRLPQRLARQDRRTDGRRGAFGSAVQRLLRRLGSVF
jgi:hypothetical protein